VKFAASNLDLSASLPWPCGRSYFAGRLLFSSRRAERAHLSYRAPDAGPTQRFVRFARIKMQSVSGVLQRGPENLPAKTGIRRLAAP